MALIEQNESIPPYFVGKGSQNVSSASASFYNIANSVIKSNKINRISNNRISFDEGGTYEAFLNAATFISTSSTIVSNIQIGINGVFVNYSTSSASSSNLTYNGVFKFIFKVDKGDYIEIRSLLSGVASSHNTSPWFSLGSGEAIIPFTVKRI